MTEIVVKGPETRFGAEGEPAAGWCASKSDMVMQRAFVLAGGCDAHCVAARLVLAPSRRFEMVKGQARAMRCELRARLSSSPPQHCAESALGFPSGSWDNTGHTSDTTTTTNDIRMWFVANKAFF